ncbi:7293_t:CDS:2, partial [Paraglomus brasilianum]
KDIKSSKVKEFWDNSSTVMEALRKASITNSKNIIHQVLGLQTDFSEALSNTTRETIQPALKRKFNEGEMTVDAGNNPFYVSQHEKDLKNATNQNEEDEITEYKYSQEMLNEKVELPNHKKTKKKNTSRTKTQKSRNKSENSSLQLPSSDVGPDDDGEINFDFTSVEMELLQEQSNEIETLEKAKIYGLKWSDFHEVLALSSIIVLSLHCPYPSHIFTNREWQTIIRENPYIVADSILPTEILSSLRSASADSLEGKTAFLSIGDSEIGRAVSRIFNDMCSSVPDIAPTKTSEDEHCFKLLHPIIRPLFFTSSYKEYNIQLNRATAGTATRPDFSCLVNEIPILNSEIKPPGFTPLQQQKDRLKVQLRGRKSINQLLRTKGGPEETAMLTNQGDLVESYVMDLKYDGLYRSWPFLTTRLVKDKTTIPLLESNIRHFMALEERISKIAENYNCRTYQNGTSTPPLQIQYMRDLPDSPQRKKLLR